GPVPPPLLELGLDHEDARQQLGAARTAGLGDDLVEERPRLVVAPPARQQPRQRVAGVDEAGNADDGTLAGEHVAAHGLALLEATQLAEDPRLVGGDEPLEGRGPGPAQNLPPPPADGEALLEL